MRFNFLIFIIALFISFPTFPASLKHDGYLIKYKKIPIHKKLNSKNYIYGLNIEIVSDIPKDLKNANIEYIEPNYIYSIEYVPEDSRYSEQYAHKNIESEKAWDISLGSREIVVAVIDTGVDYNHEDLKNNMWVNEAELNGKAGSDDDGNGFIDDIYGYDFANNDPDPMDDHGHGTHCSGVIGASHNKKGVAGVTSNVRIMSLKFLTARGSGNTYDAIRSIKYAVDNGANILSNSWGGGNFSQSLYDAIKYAKDKGVIFTAASGNSNTNKINYPSGYDLDNIVSVASSDKRDYKSSFSNYGLPHVDIAAPGSKILSTIPNNKYDFMSGTSMATPYISGALALLWSHEDMSYVELRKRLFKTSDYLPNWENYVVTSGRLNVGNLMLGIEPNRPDKPIPSKWVKKEKLIESKHPYKGNKQYKFEFDVPKDAKFLRIHFEKVDTEKNYDFVEIFAGQGKLRFDGLQEDIYSGYLIVDDVDKINIVFQTDYSVNKWGFKIDFFEYQ